nr:hypothetical protein Iba_chr12cCG18820 [Ipomoea batatas]GMD68991.1 hypothetical protein Iba_chr12dCG14600 [Ipomoea batatas]
MNSSLVVLALISAARWASAPTPPGKICPKPVALTSAACIAAASLWSTGLSPAEIAVASSASPMVIPSLTKTGVGGGGDRIFSSAGETPCSPTTSGSTRAFLTLRAAADCMTAAGPPLIVWPNAVFSADCMAAASCWVMGLAASWPETSNTTTNTLGQGDVKAIGIEVQSVLESIPTPVQNKERGMDQILIDCKSKAMKIPLSRLKNLDGVGPDIIPANVVGGNDEAEEIARLLNQNIGVGAERKLQYLGEDVGQSPELLLSASHGGVRLRKRRSDVVSYRDVSFLGHRVNLHGFRTCELWANSEEMIPSSDKKRVISRNTERRTQNRNPKTKQKLLSDMQFSE